MQLHPAFSNSNFCPHILFTLNYLIINIYLYCVNTLLVFICQSCLLRLLYCSIVNPNPTKDSSSSITEWLKSGSQDRQEHLQGYQYSKDVIRIIAIITLLKTARNSSMILMMGRMTQTQRTERREKMMAQRMVRGTAIIAEMMRQIQSLVWLNRTKESLQIGSNPWAAFGSARTSSKST